jgi:hypothetical protein
MAVLGAARQPSSCGIILELRLRIYPTAFLPENFVYKLYGI